MARIKNTIRDFIENEKTGGLLLIACTIISLLIANSAVGNDYLNMWESPIGSHSLTDWINDGLMAVFFFLVGLELIESMKEGHLSNIRTTLLPVSGALGGMLIPAGIYLLFNIGTPTASGSGIPMATDIAFALGVLSLLGNRVPASLKIFLTALAVIDDLGAIIVIALFYSSELHLTYLFSALGIFAALLLLNKVAKVRVLAIYLLGGVAVWYCMLYSGIHATIAGVLLAIAIPFDKGSKKNQNRMLQHWLHAPVAFVILPLFALANTAIQLHSSWDNVLKEPFAIGIIAGLIIGKPLGITLFSYIFVKIKLCKLPIGVNWKHILGAGILGGIGFTMSIFITLLAFDDQEIINTSKLVIMSASLVSGILGLIYLNFVLKKRS